MTRLLLERGADGRAADDNGYTAFHFAALHDNTETMAVLMEFGAYTRQKTVRTMYLEIRPGYVRFFSAPMVVDRHVEGEQSDGLK